jgi:hypothetical protein
MMADFTVSAPLLRRINIAVASPGDVAEERARQRRAKRYGLRGTCVDRALRWTDMGLKWEPNDKTDIMDTSVRSGWWSGSACLSSVARASSLSPG